jgi:hypothetical protein
MKKAFWQLLSVPFVLSALTIGGCGTTAYLVDTGYLRDYPAEAIEAPNPSLHGPYQYDVYFYGSGLDKHRKEYGEEVDFKTEPVDASGFVDIYDKIPKYWGFDFDSLPINGRVWFPRGPGPFPLVLIVHGNHKMKSYSDPGYEYLGTLLASRGFITVSVDENFLNEEFGGENDARAFVLLEHLKVWQKWNQTHGHKFEGKVDMERIALIGHSRGGESVAHAAAFNHLSRYPDDANIKFNYDFNIRSIIAIAPCEGQYMPAGHPTSIDDINYLVIQGGHDADVTAFMGLNQFYHIGFTGNDFFFKSAIYIYRANHSRFNSAWGKVDQEPPLGWFINEKPIMDEESQRQVAKVLISAFLEASINDRQEYLSIFKDIRGADEWLPDDIYISRYKDSTFEVIADFEEDFDVTTATMPGAWISCDGLDIWREEHPSFRNEDAGAQDNSTVVLGWYYDQDEEIDSDNAGFYEIDLPDDTVTELGLSYNSTLEFSIGAEDPDQYEPLDVTIELTDREGKSVQISLSSIGPVHPALPVRLAKWKWLEKKFAADLSERLCQTYEIPMAFFTEDNSAFEPSSLKSIRFIFDRSDMGIIMLDDIGISP